MSAKASRNQNSTTTRRRSVHQRSLPYWLPQAWVRSTTHRRPAWIGAGSPQVLADHAAVGQHLSAGLVVIAGVQVHGGFLDAGWDRRHETST
jgi:hypothetical protein